MSNDRDELRASFLRNWCQPWSNHPMLIASLDALLAAERERCALKCIDVGVTLHEGEVSSACERAIRGLK